MKPNSWLTLTCGLLLVLGGRTAQAEDQKPTSKCCCEKQVILAVDESLAPIGYLQVLCCSEQQATSCPQGACCTQATSCAQGKCCTQATAVAQEKCCTQATPCAQAKCCTQTQATNCAQGKCCTEGTDCCPASKAVAGKFCKDLDVEIRTLPSCCKESCCPMQVMVDVVKACLETCAAVASGKSECKCCAHTSTAACTADSCGKTAVCQPASPVCGFQFLDVLAPTPVRLQQPLPHPMVLGQQLDVFQVALPNPQVMDLVPPLPHIAVVAGVPVPYEVLPQPRKVGTFAPAPYAQPLPMPLPPVAQAVPPQLILASHAVPAMPKRVVAHEQSYKIEMAIHECQNGQTRTMASPRLICLAGQQANVSVGGFVDLVDGSIKDLRQGNSGDSKSVRAQVGWEGEFKVTPTEDGRLRVDIALKHQDVETATQDSIVIQGQSIRAVHKVKAGDVVKIALQKDEHKQMCRWVEFCVTEAP